MSKKFSLQAFESYFRSKTMGYLSGFVNSFLPAIPGSSPKHTIYTFNICSQLCAIFVFALWKIWKQTKRGWVWHIFFQKNFELFSAFQQHQKILQINRAKLWRDLIALIKSLIGKFWSRLSWTNRKTLVTTNVFF